MNIYYSYLNINYYYIFVFQLIIHIYATSSLMRIKLLSIL